MTRNLLLAATLAGFGLLSLTLGAQAREIPTGGPVAPGRISPPTVTPMLQQGASTRSVVESREAGIAWLKTAQAADGGWGAGAFGQAQGATTDAATTAMSVLALVRDGGVKGPHKAQIERGVRYLVKAVETGPRNDPRVATPTGTQPQGKLGQLVDTHMTALALAQVAGQLPAELDAQVQVALDTVVGKVQLAQQADGSFDGNGWAPVLSNSMAAMSLVEAKKKGADVAPSAIAQADRWQAGLYDEESGSFDASTGAGVNLYSVASSMRLDQQAKERGVGGAGKAEAAARAAVAGPAAEALIAGFGSIGGEEMLSYMMISDTLAEQGGEEWTSWDGKIGDYLASIQGADGSWSGHHCITSRTFVTATALLTLGAGEHARRGTGSGAGGRTVGSVRPSTEQVFGSDRFGLTR